MTIRPFRPLAGDVPIVGRPFTVNSGFPTALITCGCDAKTPVLLVGVVPSVCPACRRVFVVQKFAFDGETGSVQVSLRLGQMADAPPAPGGVPS